MDGITVLQLFAEKNRRRGQEIRLGYRQEGR